MLRVTDLDRSIQYYTEALGMRLLRKSDNESQKYSLAFMGYADEKASCVIELTYNWCAAPCCTCAGAQCSHFMPCTTWLSRADRHVPW